MIFSLFYKVSSRRQNSEGQWTEPSNHVTIANTAKLLCEKTNYNYILTDIKTRLTYSYSQRLDLGR